MLKRFLGISDHALRPSETSFQSFSGLSMSPANRQLIPTMAMGVLDSIFA